MLPLGPTPGRAPGRTRRRAVLAVGPKDERRIDALAAATVQVARPSGAEVTLTHVFSREQYRQALKESD